MAGSVSLAETEIADALDRVKRGDVPPPVPVSEPAAEPTPLRAPRRSRVACDTCAWWVPGGRMPQDNDLSLGQCRRSPPVAMRTDHGIRATWPRTLATHWCGEHGVIE